MGGFPPKVKERALVACSRHCCICHRFVGLKIELHHIKQKTEGGTDSFENCIPLCLDCHADMRSYDHNHPKGTKYTIKEKSAHRDKWYDKINKNKLKTYDGISESSDRDLLLEIKKFLPWDGAVQFFRQHPTSAPFPLALVEPFRMFEDRCSDPTFEFIDSELEGYRAELQRAISLFLNTVDESTHPLKENDSYAAIPKEWRGCAREEFYAASKKLRDSSDRIGVSHDNLLRGGKRKLGV